MIDIMTILGFCVFGFMAKGPNGRENMWLNSALRERDKALIENKELKAKLAEYEDMAIIKGNVGRMLAALKKFHDKHGFGEQGRKNPHSRITYLTEELGEVAECISKGKSKEELAEEHADLFIVLLGNCLCFDIDIEKAFWEKYEIIMNRPSMIVDGLVRLTKEE